MIDPMMAAVGDSVSSSSSSLLVIGAVLHSGSLNDDIATGQLLSSLKYIDSLSFNLLPVTMFCIMISKSSLVIRYVTISALNTVVFACELSHSKTS